jgi:sulfoxide reductase heme-binding subunit YedZ
VALGRVSAFGRPGGTDVRNLAWAAKHHFGTIRWASFALWLAPAAWLMGEWLSDSLGVNPLNRLLHFSGRWALIMLLVTLGVTPLRRLSVRIAQVVHARYGKRVADWNWLVRLRRQLGLFAFFYACLHLAVYLFLDAGLDGAALRDDISERPFVAIGFAAFVLLVPLALTSNRAAIRHLGRTWQHLHALSYPIAVLAVGHFALQMKIGQHAALPYAAVLALLLLARVLGRRRARGADANEDDERRRPVAEDDDGTPVFSARAAPVPGRTAPCRFPRPHRRGPCRPARWRPRRHRP